MESASSIGGRRTLPPLCRVHILSFAQRRSLSSSLWRRGTYSCYTNTLYPLYRDAVCHPLEDTLFCVENTISPPYGEGVCQNHVIRRAQTDGSRPQVKRYTRLVIYYYYTSTILTHDIPCTEMQYVILRIEKRTLSSV